MICLVQCINHLKLVYYKKLFDKITYLRNRISRCEYTTHKVKIDCIQNLKNNLNSRKSLDMEVSSFFLLFLSFYPHLCLKHFKQMCIRVFLIEEYNGAVYFVVTLMQVRCSLEIPKY